MRKAKIKATGEVINVYQLSNSNWYDYDNMGEDKPFSAPKAGKKEFTKDELKF